MLKEKSSKWAMAKCLYLLPLACVSVTLFATPEVTDSVKELSSIAPEKIESITVIKDSSALKPYGEKGKNGMTVIA